MSNQENSPSGETSPGTTGPIEQAFELCWSKFGGGTPEAKVNSKFIWYLSAMATYNMMVDAIRAGTKQPAILTLMTVAIKKDVDAYMATDPEPVNPGDLGTGQAKH